MKVLPRLLISIFVSLALILFLVFSPWTQVGKSFEPKLYKYAATRRLNADIKDFHNAISNWQREMDIWFHNLVSLYTVRMGQTNEETAQTTTESTSTSESNEVDGSSFLNGSTINQGETSQSETAFNQLETVKETESVTTITRKRGYANEAYDISLFENSILSNIYTSFPTASNELLGLIFYDYEKEVPIDVYFEDLLLYRKIVSEMTSDTKAIYNACINKTPLYFQNEDVLTFFSESVFQSVVAIFFVSPKRLFPDSEDSVKHIITSDKKFLGFLQVTPIDKNISETTIDFIKSSWATGKSEQAFLKEDSTDYFAFDTNQLANIALVIDPQIFRLNPFHKGMFFFILLVSFSFSIFVVLHIPYSRSYYSDIEIEMLTMQILRECFIEKSSPEVLRVLLEEESYKSYMLKSLRSIFGKRFLKRHRASIEKKIEQLWKGIFDFKLKIQAEQNLETPGYVDLDAEILEPTLVEADVVSAEPLLEETPVLQSSLETIEPVNFEAQTTFASDHILSENIKVANPEGANLALQSGNAKTFNGLLQRAKNCLHKTQEGQEYMEAIYIGECKSYVPHMFLSSKDSNDYNKLKGAGTIVQNEKGIFVISEVTPEIEKDAAFESLVSKVLHS